MSTRLPFACCSACALLLSATAAFGQTSTARLATYVQGGQTYFALSLSPALPAEGSPPGDVVVLVDTSASQAGRFRADVLAALDALLAGLRPADRVQLMAVDMRAVPMTAGLAASQGAEMTAGRAKLEARAPLGATDLESGLRAAMKQLTDAGRTKTIFYLGDAMSKAAPLNDGSLAELVADLRTGHVSVSSYVIGHQQNTQLAAALANHTGGVVAVGGADSPAAAGGGLAASVRASVAWPNDVKLSSNMAESYPAALPPLRSDRDSIVIGTLSSSAEARVDFSGTVNGRPIEIAFAARPERSSDDFAFLPKLVTLAQTDRGLSLPTAGSAGLRAAASATLSSAQHLANLGHQALSNGNFTGARQVAEAALRSDPGNPQAQAVRNAAHNNGGGEPALRLAARHEAEGPSGSLLDEVLSEPGFLGQVEQDRNVLAGKIRAQVEKSLNDARHHMAADPDTAEQELKLTLRQIESSTDLDAGLRSQLRQQVEDAIRQARQATVLAADRQSRAQEQQAIAIELDRLTTDLAQRELRLKQIMDRFDSLMEEGRYQVADEEISPEIERLAPRTRLEASVITGGRMQRAAAENELVWRNRENNYLRTLFNVEVSLIPFPDEPPIVYMPADQWEDLSIRRQKYKAVDLGQQGGSEARIFDELNKIMPVGMEFVETPLKDAIQYLQDQHSIPIVLNTKTLNDAGINPDTPVTKNLKGITLRSALRLMLKELDLTYVVRDEVLQITTPDDAESQLVTKVYPVGDLVVPIGINSNLFGLGGMGGMNGMGGMDGGMGGGMMGGMGGGMGGGMMGGGMGGMGGMMGGGMFAVEDELSLGTKKPATQDKPEPQPEVRRPAAAKVKPAQPLKIEPAAGETLAAAWDRHFAAEQARMAKLDEDQAAVVLAQSLAAVRETVRQLRNERKYGEIPVVIQSALRHGHIESWMYESLALAMRAEAELKEQPLDNDELERALLSAVDFAQSENQVIMTAAYMAQIGLHERALKLYQQIGNADPSRAEPFVQGLALAQKLNDTAAIQWACVGVLSHAWTGEHRHIGETAYRVGKATYEKLLAAGKKSQAEAFDKAVRAAQQRDCLVLVTWTGDADIDVSVEEPSGTVVSQRQPRSIAGGVHLGDVSAAGGKATAKGFSEAYICPQGFDGSYRVHIRNIWGRPTGGKVTVEVITNFGTSQQWSKREQIPIDEKNALVTFELKGGRRTDSLPEAQIAQVAKVQEANNRMLLAQQLAQYEDSEVSRNYAASIEDGKRGGGPGAFRRRGVGYRPQITTLPEGANFSSNAVISADRRYVRVSPSPTFSQIVEVNTFNFVTGQGGQQGAGQGGVGGGGVGGGGLGGGGGGFGGGGFF